MTHAALPRSEAFHVRLEVQARTRNERQRGTIGLRVRQRSPSVSLLLPYVYNSHYVHPIMEVDTDIPILLCGDFNTNVKNDETFIKFMKDMFNVDCASDVNNSTTLGGTTIDLTFSRHIKLETLPFISYFSYHRPILNRITQIVRN
ncbi:hypothetical protein Zmor_014865 [Zophobas morio]|uniref:Endonuclease/exonuclease/phosphatase domain-containing protein n=1 Tax=Zophobas morio TaxID=2755281 RepID=A0AA38IGX4_9CUCU|nr:hypothetical protein Zmor_014865 [Zophobas morio]